ncbi:MAG: GH3 auxin-responsive promoter family protein, partial [Dehalococcoidia bacterium]|nr:GH3 auxin-responsive promoter family protein [Dehalococcoidia bacterium]
LIQHGLGYDMLPSNAEGMSFQEKTRAGFEEALYQGLDAFGGLTSVVVAVGEQFKQKTGKTNFHPLLSHPKALLRVTKALIKSKLAHRPMLPKDLWSVKGIGGGGTDSTIFKKRVKELWGRYPLEEYGGTEGGIYATQTWDYEGMTFVPNLVFFEFIPEREWFKWQLDRSYQPKTVLLDEVKAGENYEVVITDFHGGVMTRYRPGDMVRITSLRNEKLNIDIPQMVFERRADDLIDISGFGRMTEKLIWQAIENTGISYVDWAARKEMVADKAILRLYVELRGNYIASEKTIAAAVYDELIKLDSVYHYNPFLYHGGHGDPETVLGLKPVEVTLLPQGAFTSYMAQRQAEGADLGNLKPPHINPSDKVLSLLGAPRVVVEAVPATEAERVATR